MPSDAPHQRTKCSRSGINLIIVGTVREGTQLLDESAIPWSFHKPDHALFILRGEWISAPFFASMFRFDGHRVAFKQACEVVGLKLAGAAWILWNSDAYFVAVEY